MGGIALAQNTVDSTFCWSGSVDENGRVITGSPDSTSGWWYEFSDENEGGRSDIQFPTDIETFDDGLFFGHLVESYGALKGEARLQDGYEYPYVGLAFNVWNIDKKGADITAWGGICLAYISTIAFSIELVPEDEKMTEDDNYKAFVSKAPSGSSYNFPWDKFNQGGWGKAADRDSVLKQVSSVRLIFQGTAGTSGDFSIGAMGSLDICALYSRQGYPFGPHAGIYRCDRPRKGDRHRPPGQCRDIRIRPRGHGPLHAPFRNLHAPHRWPGHAPLAENRAEVAKNTISLVIGDRHPLKKRKDG